jgi:hypothetical protein
MSRAPHVRVRLRAFRGSEALLATGNTVTTAVFFVHGFLGDPRGTWINFQGLSDSARVSSFWSQCDLYFYSYPSVRQQIGITARALYRFITSFFPRPPESLLKVSRPYFDGAELGARRYSEIVLVGHSEGGLVLRAMLVDRISSKLDKLRRQGQRLEQAIGISADELFDVEAALSEDPLLRSTLALFAPAHLGRNVSGISALIPRYLLAISNAYNNLDPSAELVRTIRERTEATAGKHTKLTGLVANTIFGSKENIVVVGGYKTDWQYAVLPDHTHRSICKPNETYLSPIEFVANAHDRTKQSHAGISR